MTAGQNHYHAIIRDFFSEKVTMHGANHLGVGWNSEASQRLRFDQFFHLFRESRQFSLNDIGCGYGLLYDHLVGRGLTVDYLGVDVSEPMISAAVAAHSDQPSCEFVVGTKASRIAEYSVASGIFNIKTSIPNAEWNDYVLAGIDEMDRSCTKGFAFNILTKYSDQERMRDDLFYADPERLFAHCKRRYSRNVALLHDYELYEFTLVVRKT